MREDEWVMLSEIEHWAYCPRQWAIIHLEQHFSDNDHTVRGHIAHERVDTAGREKRGDATTFWALDVASDSLRIYGRCDRVVQRGDRFVPIEHKSGRRSERAAHLQLVGQAICLEEMLGIDITEGQIYLVATNTTQDVDVADPSLRAEVCQAALDIRSARLVGRLMPKPANDTRCPACSLRPTCLPALVDAPSRQRGLHGATWWP
jgi:CRISPR-associated exonuclease Cas4